MGPKCYNCHKRDCSKKKRNEREINAHFQRELLKYCGLHLIVMSLLECWWPQFQIYRGARSWTYVALTTSVP